MIVAMNFRWYLAVRAPFFRRKRLPYALCGRRTGRSDNMPARRTYLGVPLSSFLFRALSDTNRVVVPDHMGFGKSETPQLREYSLEAHVENLSALIDELDLRISLLSFRIGAG
jgi:pimeloyl-ACP methyl ester carboxylesterase